MNFEDTFKTEIASIRAKLAAAGIGSMWMAIFVSGRTEAGDVKVSFELGKEYSTDMAKSGNLDAVVEEAIRRNDWKQANAPLCLPAA